MRMNPITLVGIALIVLGIVAFAYQGITYTSRETVIDIGPIKATAETQKTIPLLASLGRVGACRRDRLGGGRSQAVDLAVRRTGNVVAKSIAKGFLKN